MMCSGRLMILAVVWACLAVKGHAQTENGVTQPPGTYVLPYTPEIPEKFYHFGKDVDHLMPRLGRSQFVRMDLARKFPFFDIPYQTLYPNTNGAITFDQGNADLPSDFSASLNFKIIAAYWGHMEPDNCRVSQGQRSRGDIFVRETEDPATLQNISAQIRSNMPGEGRFTARWAFISTVYQTRMPVSSRWDCRNPWTTYQTILTTDGIKSFAIFVYYEMGASSNACAHAPAGGINAGDGQRIYMLPRSSTGYSGNFSETLMADSNVGLPGTWMYRVDRENISDTGCAEDGSNFQIFPRFGSLLGGTKVTVSGLCVDPASHGNITCRIGDADVTANVTDTNEFTCITPLGLLLGATKFEVALNGTSFRYETNFTYDYITTDLILHHEGELNDGLATTFNLTWDQSSFSAEEFVMIQLVIFYATPPVNMTEPADFAPAWAAQNEPQLMVVSLAVIQSNEGHIEMPSTNVLSEALPRYTVPVSGYFRMISAEDANSTAEQDGFLVSRSVVSGLKFLGKIWMFEVTSEDIRARGNFLQTRKVQVPEWIRHGWLRFKMAAPCLAEFTGWTAFESMTGNLQQNLYETAIGAIIPASYAVRAACEVYEKFTKVEGFANKLIEFTGCFKLPENRGTVEGDPEVRLETRSCPATVAQALRDSGRYQPFSECRLGSTDPSNCIWNKGATHCVLTPMTVQGISSQCCYDGAGNLMDNTDNRGGQLHYLPFGIQQKENSSSLTRIIDNRFFPDSTIAKIYNLGTIAVSSFCCAFGKWGSCKSLLSHFKPTGSKGYVPPRPAITTGDPHITTFDDCDYTFNGLGEYTIVSIPGIMNVQGRTKKTDDGRATVWQAVALRGNGGTTVHIQYNELYGLQVYLNFALLDLSEAVSTLRYPDLTIHQAANTSALEVTLDNGAAVEIKKLTKHLDIVIYLPDNGKGLARGLFGSWHANGSKDLYAPDDRVYLCNSSAETLFEFGNQWRVPKAQSLFTYRTGESYELFNDLLFRPAFEPIPLNATVEQEAKEFCGASRQCFFDYVVTGDRELASDTAQAFHEFDQILVDTAPVISCGFSRPGDNAIVISVNNSYLEGDIVRFRCAENSTKLSGKEEVQCRSDGTWSGDALACKSVASCGPSQPGQNAVVISVNNSFIEGDVVRFQCTGNTTKISGEESIHCRSDGTWSGIALTCGVVSQVSCGPKNPGQNATIISTGNTFAEGDVLRYQCLTNHTKSSGQEELRCQSNGTWNGDALTCRAMASCGPRHPGQNAVIVSQNNTFLEGDTLKFQCTGSSAKKSGKEEIKCRPDATWDGDALTCSACRLFGYAYLWFMLYFVLRRSCNF